MTPDMERAHRFWAKQKADAKLPGHCCRCGKESVERTCPRCKQYYKDVRLRKAMSDAFSPQSVRALLRRVASLELAVSRLQLSGRSAYKRGYSAGHENTQRRLRYRLEGLRGEHSAHRVGCKTSYEELAQLNHAYGRSDER